MLGIATEHWEFSRAMRFVGGDVLEVKAANLKGEHRMSGFVKTSSMVLVYLSHSAPVSPSSTAHKVRPVHSPNSRPHRDRASPPGSPGFVVSARGAPWFFLINL